MPVATANTRADVENHAKKLGWSAYDGMLRERIYLRGSYRIHVQYRKDGAIQSAERFLAHSMQPGSAVPAGVAYPPDRRTTVIAWLVED